MKGIEAIGLEVKEGQHVFYTLCHESFGKEGKTIIIKSEEVVVGHLGHYTEGVLFDEVAASIHVEWEDIDFGSLELTSSQMHGNASGVFLVTVHAISGHASPTLNTFPIVPRMTDEREESTTVLHLSVDLNEVIQVSKREGAVTGSDNRNDDCSTLCQTSKECCFVWERDSIACQSMRMTNKCRLMDVVHPSNLYLLGL